jgi:hypothetical protein
VKRRENRKFKKSNRALCLQTNSKSFFPVGFIVSFIYISLLSVQQSNGGKSGRLKSARRLSEAGLGHVQGKKDGGSMFILILLYHITSRV